MKIVASSRGTRFGIATVAGLVLFASTVSGAVAAHVFADVPDDAAHGDAIAWAAANGITTGCDDAGNFCPSDPVTRAQVAAFLHRLSGADAETGPVVDAATVGGLTPAELRSGAGTTGATGAPGSTGQQGPPGEQGIQGDPGSSWAGPVGEVLTFRFMTSAYGNGGSVTIVPHVVRPDGSMLQGAAVAVPSGQYDVAIADPSPQFGAYAVGYTVTDASSGYWDVGTTIAVDIASEATTTQLGTIWVALSSDGTLQRSMTFAFAA